MIDPGQACLYIPPEIKGFKLDLFQRVGARLGRIARHDPGLLARLPADIVPVVGCTPALRPLIDDWLRRKRTFVYWDRGYFRRVFATWLPRGSDGGCYRWHVNSYQAQSIRDVPDDRWRRLDLDRVVRPWQKGGRHIVIAAGSRTYGKFHDCRDWIADTVYALSLVTDRQLVIRDKEQRRPLQADLDGAHALVTHGSIAAVESVVLGCPVFVDATSAAALVGSTDLRQIEHPIYPERRPWLASLAYSQFDERELVDGTLWRLLQ